MNNYNETGINHSAETREEKMVNRSNKTQAHNMVNSSNTVSELDLLRQRILAGHYKEDIMADMELSQGRFTNLYLRLLQKDKQFYEVREKISSRVRVCSNGSFRVTASILEGMGLDTIFKDGAYVNLERDGNRIIASVVTSEQSTEKGSLIVEESSDTDAPSFDDPDCSVIRESEDIYDDYDLWPSSEPVDFNPIDMNPTNRPLAPIDEREAIEIDRALSDSNKTHYRSVDEYRRATGQEPPKVARIKEEVA